MAKGVYIISGGGLTLVNAVCTLVWINPDTDASFEILRAWASQSANATSNQQRVQTNTQVTSFPTVTSVTPRKTAINDQASTIVGATNGAAGTAGINATAEGAGSKSLLIEDSFNVLNGFLHVPTPLEVQSMNASAASGWGLHFPAAAISLANWATGIFYREL